MANTHSIDYDGASSQYSSIADASQSGLDITGDISISCWAKFDDFTGDKTLVAKWTTGGNLRAYRMVVPGSTAIRFDTSTDGTGSTEGTVTVSALSANTWYHIGISKSSTTATVYLNGSSAGTATVDSSQANTTAAFVIGAIGNPTNYMSGRMNDVIIYNAAIGANMSTNYNTPCSPYLTNAVSRWFDTGENSNDSIGSNDLTNQNSPTYSTDVAYSCSGRRVFMIT